MLTLAPTVMAKALAELTARLRSEPIPVPEVSEATMLDFELCDMLGAPARTESTSNTDTEFWMSKIEPDLAFMEV